MSLGNDMPVVANISEARLKGAVINFVLDAVYATNIAEDNHENI